MIVRAEEREDEIHIIIDGKNFENRKSARILAFSLRTTIKTMTRNTVELDKQQMRSTLYDETCYPPLTVVRHLDLMDELKIYAGLPSPWTPISSCP